ncbi:MAG: hypothetical protein AAF333_08855 [Planctomycetota bacterium]
MYVFLMTLMRIVLALLLIHVCVSHSGHAQIIDEVSWEEVLRKAIATQESIQQIEFDFDSRVTTVRNDDFPEYVGWQRLSQGSHLVSDRRRRSLIDRQTLTPSGSVDFQASLKEVLDGENAKFLRTINPSDPRGFIDPDSSGLPMSHAVWLTDGDLYGLRASNETVSQKHYLRQILEDSLSGSQLKQERGPSGDLVYAINAELPWGQYEIWLDPAKDYSVVKLDATITEASVFLSRSVRYTTDYIELQEVDGRWFPESIKFRTVFETDTDGITEENTVVQLSNPRFSSERANDDEFIMDWPDYVYIHDRVLGIKYGRDQEHPLNQMALALMQDRKKQAVARLNEEFSAPNSLREEAVNVQGDVEIQAPAIDNRYLSESHAIVENKISFIVYIFIGMAVILTFIVLRKRSVK